LIEKEGFIMSNSAQNDGDQQAHASPPTTYNQAMEQKQFFMPLKQLPTPPELKDVPGAQTWVMEGSQHGVLATSILIAQVEPGGGPPLHLHYTEEIQFVSDGHEVDFLIGDKRFTINEPGVVHIPAHTPHAFVNRGTQSMQVVTFFPSAVYDLNWKVVGPNPLLDNPD